MPRGSRLLLWSVALLLSLSLYFKGRVPTAKHGDAALLPFRGGVTVRMSGAFPRPGVYRFLDGVTVLTGIRMTVPDIFLAGVSGIPLATPLVSGDVLLLSRNDGKNAVISIGKMGVKERMMLGIPLDPDNLEIDGWSQLPGIGPVLSQRIAEDRHKNGAFGSLEGVLRVPGIGPAKLELIRRYF